MKTIGLIITMMLSLLILGEPAMANIATAISPSHSTGIAIQTQAGEVMTNDVQLADYVDYGDHVYYGDSCDQARQNYRNCLSQQMYDQRISCLYTCSGRRKSIKKNFRSGRKSGSRCIQNSISGVGNRARGCGNVVSGVNNRVSGNNNVVSGVNNRVCGNNLVVSGSSGVFGNCN